MQSKNCYIEENLFGNQQPIGTAKQNYESFFQNWGEEGLTMNDGYEITVDDIQEYIDELFQAQKERDE